MPRARSIPTDIITDPDFNDLSESAQLLVMKLTIMADDAGRGHAHLGTLARLCNKDSSTLAHVFNEVVAAGYIVCYVVEGKRYYQHLHWDLWETLSKPTRSRFPAPPARARTSDVQVTPASLVPPDKFPQGTPGESGERRADRENAREAPCEVEGEEKRREEEAEGKPLNIVLLPTTRDGDSVSEETMTQTTEHIAQILRIQASPALVRVVAEFVHDPKLSFLSEADAAREYIDDPRRNRKRQPMTPAFFRRWLKRERGDYAPSAQTGATDPGPRTGNGGNALRSTSLVGKSLMGLEEHYQQARGKKGESATPLCKEEQPDNEQSAHVVGE